MNEARHKRPPIIDSLSMKFRISKSIETGKSISCCEELRVWTVREELLIDMHSFWGDENVLELDNGDCCTTL